MSYSEVLSYLYSQLPMYQRIGQAAYKADLESTKALMRMLDQPEKKFKAVHVAGTNGKGSVSHLLASVFQEAGYKTGLLTSPHLVDFRERVRINGNKISEESVIEFVNRYKADFERLELSFFEWNVGLAFDHFVKSEIDIAIVEVGMGGRLDSTNVVNPDLSIITNIGMDHNQFLGESLARIAMEKGGIIKRNVPVIVGKSQRETEGIFRKTALQLDAPIIFTDQLFPHEVPECPLNGTYQKENFQTALTAIDRLNNQGWNIRAEHILAGFQNVIKNTKLRGRWERIQDKPQVICDVGHNIDGLQAITEQLSKTPYHDLHLVLGFVADKDVKQALSLFPKDAKLYLTQPDIPRAMPINRLSKIADEMDLKFQAFDTVKLAYIAARKASHSEDLIFVGGSTFVVADLLKIT